MKSLAVGTPEAVIESTLHCTSCTLITTLQGTGNIQLRPPRPSRPRNLPQLLQARFPFCPPSCSQDVHAACLRCSSRHAIRISGVLYDLRAGLHLGFANGSLHSNLRHDRTLGSFVRSFQTHVKQQPRIHTQNTSYGIRRPIKAVGTTLSIQTIAHTEHYCLVGAARYCQPPCFLPFTRTWCLLTEPAP